MRTEDNHNPINNTSLDTIVDDGFQKPSIKYDSDLKKIEIYVGANYFYSGTPDITPFKDLVDNMAKKPYEIDSVDLIVSGNGHLPNQKIESGWKTIWQNVKDSYSDEFQRRERFFDEHKNDLYMASLAASLLVGGTVAAFLGKDTGIGSLIGVGVMAVPTIIYSNLRKGLEKQLEKQNKKLSYCNSFQRILCLLLSPYNSFNFF
jgi:hypothetical protein